MSAQRERAGNAAKRSTAPGAAVQAGGDPGRTNHQVTCLKGTHPSMCQSVETREKVTELRKRNECRSGKLGYCENRRTSVGMAMTSLRLTTTRQSMPARRIAAWRA